MESEAFYTTAAQVLPTLLIALTVEIGFILQVLDRDRQTTPEWREQVRRSMIRYANASLGLGVVFLVGEVLAFLAIGFHWFNSWLFAGIAFCLLLMFVSAVFIPFVRILESTDWT